MKTARVLLIVGAVLFFGGVSAGFLGTLIGVRQSFKQIAESKTPPRPSDLADGISDSLLSTVAGVSISVVGFCLLVAGTILYAIQKPRPSAESTEVAPCEHL